MSRWTQCNHTGPNTKDARGSESEVGDVATEAEFEVCKERGRSQ